MTQALETKTILIADDNYDNRTLLKLFLSKTNYNIVECQNGLEVLEVLQTTHVDLIVMDIHMPKMNGLDATYKVRQTHPHLPVLFATANDINDVIDKIYASGGHDFICKPIRKIEFIHRVENLLKMSDLRITNQQQLNLFKKFVPNILLENGKLNLNLEHDFDTECYREEKDYSALFIDIRKFTHLCEELNSKEVFSLLNSYFNHLDPVISQFGGFIYQYLGDSLLALYPPTIKNSTDNVLHSAISLVDTIKIYNKGRERAGYNQIGVGIGINTGPISLGIAGTKEQMASGAFGNTIHVASNCEELCFKYKADIIITEKTLEQLANPDAFLCRYLGKENIRGHEQKHNLFEVFSSNSPNHRNQKLAVQTELEDLRKNHQFSESSNPEFLDKIDNIINNYPNDPLPKLLKMDILNKRFLN